MRYYKNKNTKSEIFIEEYKIENSEIIIRLASGEDYIVPYNKENEKKILLIMEKQVREAYYKPFSTLDKINFITLPVSTTIELIGMMNNNKLFDKILLGALAFCDVCYIIKLFGYFNVKYDLKRNRYFLENKDYINDNFKPTSNMMIGLSNKKQNQILENNLDEDIFDINKISNYSLGDLKKIVKNIDRACKFNFVDEDEQKKQDNNKSL